MAKKYSRLNDVAARYGCHPRNVSRMVADGGIPAPFYLRGGRVPYWDEVELDKNDRRAATTTRATDKQPAA